MNQKKLRIAFDVQGTLIGGRDPVKVRYLLVQAAKRGHEVTVWSNNYTFTQDFKEQYPAHSRHVLDYMKKLSTSDMENQDIELFDLAFEDDRNQTYLGAKQIINVFDLPSITEEYMDSIGITDLGKPSVEDDDE